MTRALVPGSLHAALAAVATAMLVASPAAGQRLESRFDAAGQSDARENPVIEVTKWSTGALAAAAGVYAFVLQGDAEDAYEELEAICLTDPELCRGVTENGAYADPALEARYQDIRSDFRRSRLLLVGAHVLAVGSAVLFIVDLPRDETPENVPYEPPSLRVGVRPDGALEAGFRYPVSNIRTRSP